MTKLISIQCRYPQPMYDQLIKVDGSNLGVIHSFIVHNFLKLWIHYRTVSSIQHSYIDSVASISSIHKFKPRKIYVCHGSFNDVLFITIFILQLMLTQFYTSSKSTNSQNTSG